jgi:large subunit ribosomal protein L6
MLAERYCSVFGKDYMSRIGRTPITIPSGVTVELQDKTVVVRGSKGELKLDLPTFTSLDIAEGEVNVARTNNSRQARANHGLARSLIQNLVEGVSEGFTKRLELVGTGYRASMKGAGISMTLGFSHPVEIPAVPGITLSLEGNNIVIVQGIDKQLVGQVAADIRKLRPPEPYKGKGIRYEGEQVRRKQGKATAA